MGWLIGTSPHRLGAQVRTVGLDEDPVERDVGGRGTKGVEALVGEGDHAGERDVQAQGRGRPRRASRLPVNEWSTPWTGGRAVLELLR